MQAACHSMQHSYDGRLTLLAERISSYRPDEELAWWRSTEVMTSSPTNEKHARHPRAVAGAAALGLVESTPDYCADLGPYRYFVARVPSATHRLLLQLPPHLGPTPHPFQCYQYATRPSPLPGQLASTRCSLDQKTFVGRPSDRSRWLFSVDTARM